ncbi:MAG: aminotransferase class I/II-fold pyridoxal phosphate-dependent enzyme, partial [Planctomycetaceae bacterium]
MKSHGKYRVKFIDYPLQYSNLQSEIQQLTHQVLSAGDLILRQQTTDFESHLAAFCGTRYAIGVSNCTDALFLSFKAAGLGPGDEVITVGHTFVATVASIVHTGATPILVDIQDDHNIDPACVEAAITPRTRALVPVSLNGRTAQLDVLADIAQRHELLMIEDSAQGLGATLQGKMAGSWGLAGCFSFYPAKLLGTFGDAGAIITDDAELADRLRLLRN